MEFFKFDIIKNNCITKLVNSVYGIDFYRVFPKDKEFYNLGPGRLSFNVNNMSIDFEFDGLYCSFEGTQFKKDFYTIFNTDKKIKSFLVGVNYLGYIVTSSEFLFEE